MNSMTLGRRLSMTVGILALIILVLASCMPVQPVADVSASAEEEVDMEAVANGIWAEYVAANVAGDAKRWIALWDDDGVQLPPGSEPVVGKEAILAKKLAGNEQWDTLDMTITNQEVRAEGGWAYVRGVYDVTRAPKAGGDSITLEGKYMSILKQQPDGSWKLYRDLFNSNTP